MIEIEIKDGYIIDLTQKVWWRPINTAPKDGTDVLLFVPDAKMKIHIGSYYSNETFSFGVSTRKSEGWSLGLVWSMASAEPDPTYWMPLPDGPL